MASDFNVAVTHQVEAANGSVLAPEEVLNMKLGYRLKEYEQSLATCTATAAAFTATDELNKRLTREQADRLHCALKQEAPIPQVPIFTNCFAKKPL
jgi:hypothetical protein